MNATAVIIDSIRTPIGNLGGALAGIRPDDLAAHTIRALLERSGVDPALIDEVYLGCANQAGEDNRDIARMAALLAGLPFETGGVTFNRLCASGLTAVSMAARAIQCGEGDVFIAGGVESMSRAPYSLPKAEHAYPFGHATLWDTTLGWRYPHPEFVEKGYTINLGETAENLAESYHISRAAQDAFALQSHQRAVAAIDSGIFAQEITPLTIPQRKGEALTVATDERPRRDSSLEALARLKPSFKEGGTVTAGNSSGLNDGAAMLLMMSVEKAKMLGLQPKARVVCSAAVGVDPRLMGIGPVPATRKALQRAGLQMQDIGLVELNEAFAAQALAVMQVLGLSSEITNVHGGAIALGHPLGCSGARILTTLLHEMGRRASQWSKPFYGLASLCVGVGQGESLIVEWLDS
ncbi:MAG: thiolase family protein [Pelolinea sp.]|jgi:acetyl-CoA acyltransferase|nr:thiolase family protein [Pelolinea sp.]